MNGQSVRKYPKLEEIVPILKLGIVISSALLFPHAAGAVAKLLSKKDETYDFDPSYLRRVIRKLERRKLVSLVEDGSRVIITLTEKGKKWVLSYEVDSMRIAAPNRWDKRWRGVIFDVSEKKKRNREQFVKKLKDLGFFAFQESVYFYSYPCGKEIEFLRNFYGVAKEVSYFVIEKIEDDSFLRSKFDLPL